MKTGHIEIRNNKVIFVYHELEKPESKNYYRHGFIDFETVPVFDELAYENAMKEYEASRKEIEVKNVILQNVEMFFWIEDGLKFMIGVEMEFENNQLCEAKIENDLATITKIL